MKYELPELKITPFTFEAESFDVTNAETGELYGPEESFETAGDAESYALWLTTELLKLQKGMWLMKSGLSPEFVDAELMELHENWKKLSPACKIDCENIMIMQHSFPLEYESMECWLTLKSEYLEFVA